MQRGTVRSRWILLCLLVLSAGLYIGTAGSPALDDEDVDAAHAMVSQEMLQRNDFVVMYMDGVRYLIRPPMHFWMVAASYKLLGESEFATRLAARPGHGGNGSVDFRIRPQILRPARGTLRSFGRWPPAWGCSFSRGIMIPEAIYALAFEGIFYLFFVRGPGAWIRGSDIGAPRPCAPLPS